MSDADAAAGGILDAGLLLRPARTANAFEETVRRVLQTIRLGLIPPGERLPPERELAVMMDVSRDTLRDAIASLNEAGWVVSRRGRGGGTFVSEVLPAATVSAEAIAALEDTLALRAVVDVGIARRAAATDLTAADRERLWQAHLECAGAEYPSGYHQADARFHLVLAELLGSPATTRLAADIRLRLDELLSEVPLLVPSVEHSDAQHQQIAEAILRGRPEEAAEIMTVHVDGTAALLRGFFA